LSKNDGLVWKRTESNIEERQNLALSKICPLFFIIVVQWNPDIPQFLIGAGSGSAFK
jgi:hypothetical protein